jgi:EAL domain-containing protein (putative c-di-GMP-specific phosphodiesterase class I)
MLRWNDHLARVLGRPLGGPHQSGVKKQLKPPSVTESPPAPAPASAAPAERAAPPVPAPDVFASSAPGPNTEDPDPSGPYTEAAYAEAPCIEAHGAPPPYTEEQDTREPFATLRSDPPPDAIGLTAKDIDVVFQPIVSVTTRRVFAYEALTRCRWPSLANPEVLFERASRASCCGRLGRIVRAAAMERAGSVPLFVNVHPDELSERWLVRPDDPVFFHDHDVYLEITESAAFTHYDVCVNVLREVRSRAGIFLAVDDLGAGHSNLKRVLDLEPRIVKLDRALVTGLDQSYRQQILVRHVVRLCMELGAEVVAEGIETADELSAVIDSGAHYAQGYLLGRPAYPLPPAVWPGDLAVPR